MQGGLYPVSSVTTLTKPLWIYGAFQGTPGQEGDFSQRNYNTNATTITGNAATPLLYVSGIATSVTIDGVNFMSANPGGALNELTIDETAPVVTVHSLVTSNTTPQVSGTVTVAGITVINDHTIDVTFSEPMGATSLTAANYSVSGLGVGTLAVNPNSASRQGADNLVRLTWNAPQEMNGGTPITVTVSSNVKDLAGNGVGTPNSASALAIGTGPDGQRRDAC